MPRVTTQRVAVGWVGSALLSLGCRAQSSEAATPESSRAAAPASPAAASDAALLQEDFEGHATGKPPGAPFVDATGNSGASVLVDETRAFSGRRSVHVFAPKGASYRRGYFAIHGAPVFPAAAREMYGRLMVFLDAAPITPAGSQNVHWTLLQGEGRSESDEYNAIYRYGGQHQGGLGLMANFETTPPVESDCWQHSKSTLPVQRWACVEWHFRAPDNQMDLWLDGASVGDLSVRDRATGAESGCLHDEDLGGQWRAPPAFQSLYVGWERYQEPDNDRHVWIDDLVVAKSRIGCP